MSKIKKQITTAIKPSSLIPRTTGAEKKGKDLEDKLEESKDTSHSV
jgi:hypothetical protein